MTTLMLFRGTVMAGFVGNIQYHYELPESYSRLKITLYYDKNLPKQPSLIQKEVMYHAYCTYMASPIPVETYTEILPDLWGAMKTEIQLAAFLNQSFVGNIHRSGQKKEMFLSLNENEISLGCMPLDAISGHLQIILQFFQVLYDQTNYTLTIEGE